MWNNVRDHNPQVEKVYLVQMTTGALFGLEYTKEGGWNTHYDTRGNLCNAYAISDMNVARWFDAPDPPEVPDEWFEEMRRSEAVNEV